MGGFLSYISSFRRLWKTDEVPPDNSEIVLKNEQILKYHSKPPKRESGIGELG
jgi:hypothetical protein